MSWPGESPFAKGDRVRVQLSAGFGSSRSVIGRGTVASVHPESHTCDVILDDETRTDARGEPIRHGYIWLDLERLDVVEQLGELA